jgi:hypothetical protein
MTRHVPREEVLQDVLDGLVSRKSLRHAVLGVLRGDESFRWIGAAGDADGQGTPMLSGSMSEDSWSWTNR